MSANAQLAVFLRQITWLLDDVARDVPRLDDAKKAELASILDAVANLVRSTVQRCALDAEPLELPSEDCDDLATARALRGKIADVFGYTSYESTVLSDGCGLQVGVYVRDLRVLLNLAGR